MTVMVACGGRSLERSISLDSGRRAARALERAGHDIAVVDIDATLVERVLDDRPEWVFMAMHGIGGEDGTVQDLLELLDLAYTGSDAVASALCLDKHLFKSVCSLADVPTPPWHSFTKQAFADYGAAGALDAVLRQFPGGVVVKPARQGSSLGISVVRDDAALRSAVLEAMSYDDRVILEEFMPGRELAVTVMGSRLEPRTLPTVELLFDDEIYSYAAHYTVGSAQVVRAELGPAVEQHVKEVAERAYRVAGCRDFARVDIRLTDDVAYVLEINTLPGLTETGPAPLAADFGGLSFDAFVAAICERVQRGGR